MTAALVVVCALLLAAGVNLLWLLWAVALDARARWRMRRGVGCNRCSGTGEVFGFGPPLNMDPPHQCPLCGGSGLAALVGR